MPNRIEMFRRLERQYFRDRLGTLGLQQLDGMILHLLGREGHMRQEDLAVQLARPGGAAGERPVPPGEACLSDSRGGGRISGRPADSGGVGACQIPGLHP